MLNPSRFAIVDEQVRDPDGKPIGVIRAKPPFLVMADQGAIVETPEAAQYVEMPEHIDQEWAGRDPPAVYLRFETEQELRRVLAKHVMDHAPGYGSGVFGQGPFGGDEPAPPTVNAYDWTGIERRLAASPDVVAAIHEKVLELDRLVERSGLSNYEQQRAKALSVALIHLLESPEPEWRIIVAILNSEPIKALATAVQLATPILAGIWALITG